MSKAPEHAIEQTTAIEATASDDTLDLLHEIVSVISIQLTTSSARTNDATTSSAQFMRCVPYLPPEIIGMVVDEIRSQMGDEKEWRRQLCVVARTSRRLRVDAERNLYQELIFALRRTPCRYDRQHVAASSGQICPQPGDSQLWKIKDLRDT